jgi:choline dehydrogenase
MLCDRFLSACKDAGISYLEDYNQEETEGASLLQFTIKNGIRQSTAKAFLEPVRHRPNLQVKTGVTVDRIILEKNKAVGVSVCNSKGNTEVFYCHAELILCAGAIHSPVILQRSGIGPEAALKQYGVSVLNKLDGVGANLQDHLWTGLSMFTNIPTANALRSPLELLKSIFQYATNKTGILSNGPLGANAFLRTSAELDRPDIQVHLAKMAIKPNYQTDPYDIQTFPGKSGLGLLSILLHPLSRGFVHLRSTDPRANPIIQPNFLSESKDLEILKCGFEKVIEIAVQEPFKQICPDGPHIPKLPLDNDQMTQHILRSVETLFHPVGTCKMGTDDLAVVDATLRVHGIKGLRVADASIMPEITSGNTNAPTIMIAERAAEWILAY